MLSHQVNLILVFIPSHFTLSCGGVNKVLPLHISRAAYSQPCIRKSKQMQTSAIFFYTAALQVQTVQLVRLFSSDQRVKMACMP